MSGELVPGDQTYHDDKQLLADLTGLNAQLSRYVLRMLDAEANRGVPTSPDDERALAEAMTTLAAMVQERADRRATSDATPALEGEPALQRLTNGRLSERC